MQKLICIFGLKHEDLHNCPAGPYNLKYTHNKEHVCRVSSLNTNLSVTEVLQTTWSQQSSP